MSATPRLRFVDCHDHQWLEAEYIKDGQQWLGVSVALHLMPELGPAIVRAVNEREGLLGALRDTDSMFGHIAYNLRQALDHPVEGEKIPKWLRDRIATMIQCADNQGRSARAALKDAEK